MKTIVNTSRRVYYFDESYILYDITDPTDPLYDVEVLEPVNEGQFRNIYICTNNYRRPKKWNGLDTYMDDLEGLINIGVIRARTMEINNSHVIFGNIAKLGSGVENAGRGIINEVGNLINTVTTVIDLFGMSVGQGYKRYNKTVLWSDINRPEYWIPASNNQAGDLDFDETGDSIVRIKKLAEYNVVYKEKSIWLLIHVGLPFVYVKKFVTETVGLLAVNAIVEANNIHYFVGNDYDIYRFDGVTVQILSAEQGIREYIISHIDRDYQYESHASVDYYRKEIEFHFHGKNNPTGLYRDFSIVYNYEKQLFSRRDSVAKCSGYFEETPPNKAIDEIETIIDTIPTLINDFLSPSTVNSSATLINQAQDLVDDYKQAGVPKWKLLIGDREGKLHLYNQGDSFDGEDILAEFETGDEDFGEVSKGNLTDHLKIIGTLQLMIENQGTPLDLEVYIGCKDYMDHPIKWYGPYLYKQNASSSALLKTRAIGVHQRFRIRSKYKNQFIRILGYTPDVRDYGEIGR